MKQAIIYARHSPRRNAEQCESVETQIELCQDFCKKNDYGISGIFFDKNMSGGDENRPGLWNAISPVVTIITLLFFVIVKSPFIFEYA